jgi:hypothetical protein
MRDYFGSLGESAHPQSADPRARAITRFQELLLVAFREFGAVGDDTILAERRRLRAEVVHAIESFAKRAAVRNLRSLAVPPPEALVTTADGSTQAERAETRIGLRTFRVFLSEAATWARDEKVVMNGLTVRARCGETSVC